MLEWCLDRWQKSVIMGKGRSAKHLANIQNPACYYACLVVKRTGKTHSEDEKKK